MVLRSNIRRNFGRCRFFRYARAELIDAINIRVRYDTEDERGETRRERNETVEISSPLLIVPDYLEHLWEWYFALSRRCQRVNNGVCSPIPPSEILAWLTLTGTLVHTHEYDILCGMDDAYCAAVNEELSMYRVRTYEQNKTTQISLPRRRR